MNRSKNKSPIKSKRLRRPGESLSDQRNKLLDEKILTYFLIVCVLWVFSIYEWFRFLNNIPPRPITFLLLAIVCTVAVALRVWTLMPQIRRLNLGITGEEAVGEYLDRFRERGYRIFHDVQSAHGNIDHVLITKSGVFTIETKTRKKPSKGKALIEYDGDRVLENGFSTQAPIIQAKAQGNEIGRLLHDLTGRKFPVRSVVVYPGWFVKSTHGNGHEVWVLEPKALYKWIERIPESISTEDLKLAANQLSRHIRESWPVD